MYKTLTFLLLVGAQSWAAPGNSHDDKDMHPRHFETPLRSAKLNSLEQSSQYWIDNAQKRVNKILARKVNQNVAKNVILFLGDGMSIPTVTAARVSNGGEETQLSFDKFPYTALSKTYTVDKQVPDSGSAATAYLCGVKANYGTVGVGPEVSRSDCMAQTNASYDAYSVAYYSQRKKKLTGLVTTARVTDASAAGVYAHSVNRDWEDDSIVMDDGADPLYCTDIARQLVSGDTGRKLNVVLGGGRKHFLPNTVKDEEGYNGNRKDGTNLISLWLSQKENAEYVWNRDQLLALDGVDDVLGLFGHTHMDYNLDRNKTMDPSLAEMTEAAIKILSRGENGYFLFVEGGRIDTAHHDTEARVALDETIEFSKAVQTAVDLTDEEDTLIIVTSDHAHTMSLSGYAERGHDIFEFGGKGDDGIVYTTLNYANGPGYHKDKSNENRHDPSKDNYRADHYQYPANTPLNSETHGGDDVAVFAKGPWAHLFTGVLEENVLPHLMAFASCVGDGVTACDEA